MTANVVGETLQCVGVALRHAANKVLHNVVVNRLQTWITPQLFAGLWDKSHREPHVMLLIQSLSAVPAQLKQIVTPTNIVTSENAH